jgi:hypothetical protein
MGDSEADAKLYGPLDETTPNTDWACPQCKKLNYGAECDECGFELPEIHS